MTISFEMLNIGWNAEPNAPDPKVIKDGMDIVLGFTLNSFIFRQFREDEQGAIRFRRCTRYRLGVTNDEGWWSGQCRFSGLGARVGRVLLRECP